MRENIRCNCHICKIERHLFISLSEPPGNARFAALTLNSSSLARFATVPDLLADLHAARDGDSPVCVPGELLSTLIQTGAARGESQLIQSILVLAFTPTIHRTYREVRAWFRQLEPEDIAQQVLTFFLELATSAQVEHLNGILPIMLARTLRKNAFRWAEKEYRIVLQREIDKQRNSKNAEPAQNDNFESVSILNDFLDYCERIAVISAFERDLLVRLKIDGFFAKEIIHTHTALSEKAVHWRVERILQKLQKVAIGLRIITASSLPTASNKHISKSAGNFSLGSENDFLPISKSRRQLSLDIPSRQATTKAQQFSTPKQDSLIRFANLASANGRRCAIRGAASRRLAALQPTGSALTPHDSKKSGESSPSNPDAGSARIIRKELAGNEENPAKENCLPLARYQGLAPSCASTSLVLAHLRVSGIRSSARRLPLGERRQRVDAGVHDHHRSRPVARLHCGRRLDLRFW
jgi:hypothetical protein